MPIAAFMLSVAIPISAIAYRYVSEGGAHRFEDIFGLLLPVFPAFSGIALCIWLWLRTPRAKGVTWCLWGLMLVSAAICAFQWYFLASNFRLIAHDGTAHWAMMELPVIWIWTPITIAGALAGTIVHYVKKNEQSNNAL